MNKLAIRTIKQVTAFISENYILIFFAIALGIKLHFFNTAITKVTWNYDRYIYGVICGYLSAAVIFAPLIFIKKHKNKIAIILATLVSLLILVDTIYFSYFSALPSIGLLNNIGQTKDVGPAISGLMKWWLLLYFIDVLLIIIFNKSLKSLADKVKNKYNLQKSNNRTKWFVMLSVALAFWLSLMSMGINTLTDFVNKSFDNVSTSQPYGLLVAHAIDIVRYVDQETTNLSVSEQKDLIGWIKDNQPNQKTTNKLTGSASGKNVILIQVESLGGFVINQTINDKKITPNLNNLANTSEYFPNNKFLYGGGHTSDADFAANTSYFPLDDAAVFVRFGHADFTSLPKNLTAHKYSSIAYHGFSRNFWNRDVALKSLGYQKFYAADNYPKDFKINMGLNDGDFLSKTADYIKDQPKPSLSYVITLSSHVPFAIYDQTKELGININDYPEQVGGYLENINYTDRMLGEFFEKLKSYDLYDDSLIVVYGDHNPVLQKFSAGSINYDPDTVQGKEVPLIVKLPGATTGNTHPNKGTNLDITPTILDLLGIETKQLMFGQSLFTDNDKSLRVCPDQFVVFKYSGDCKQNLLEEKSISSTIIRYNQFDKLP